MSQESDPQKEQFKRKRLEFDAEEYTLRKRLPRRFPKRRNDVYVSMKTNFKSQFERCLKLMDGGEDEIYIHGLGRAANRAINLALQLKSHYLNNVCIAVNTSTLEVVDDFEPETDELEAHSQKKIQEDNLTLAAHRHSAETSREPLTALAAVESPISGDHMISGVPPIVIVPPPSPPPTYDSVVKKQVIPPLIPPPPPYEVAVANLQSSGFV